MRMLAGIVLLSGAAFCQPAANKPSFDAADVHVSPRSDWAKNPRHTLQGGFLSNDRYELKRATMLELIHLAYTVDADKIFGGPSWLDYDRFEIAAKTKRGTKPEALRAMLQTLLEDRFHLVVKAESRPVPGYVLAKGKGELKLKPGDGSTVAGCQPVRTMIAGDSVSAQLQCHNVAMDAFALALRRAVSGALKNMPVVDSTGLDGTWDIDFRYSPMQAQTGVAADANIVEALDKLGLKLEASKIPQPVLVVESVNEQPSANPPGTAESLPPLPPPEFEVAAIKWPCEGSMSIAPRFESGGRLTATCMALMSLIKQAWNLAIWEEPVGSPKWLTDNSTSHNISIAAKAAAGVAPDPQHNAQARELINTMLRALLTERYQMKVHFEDHQMDAHTLVAVKPKLTKADPANRTGCTRQNQQNQGRALLVRLVCQNMTMAQFAEQITAYDLELNHPVLDGTGIEGAWDFTLNYDAMASLNSRFPGQPTASADGEAADPSGTIGFVGAMEKQLGLKLEVHKRPVPVLVIDHIEEKPTEN